MYTLYTIDINPEKLDVNQKELLKEIKAIVDTDFPNERATLGFIKKETFDKFAKKIEEFIKRSGSKPFSSEGLAAINAKFDTDTTGQKIERIGFVYGAATEEPPLPPKDNLLSSVKLFYNTPNELKETININHAEILEPFKKFAEENIGTIMADRASNLNFGTKTASQLNSADLLGECERAIKEFTHFVKENKILESGGAFPFKEYSEKVLPFIKKIDDLKKQLESNEKLPSALKELANIPIHLDIIKTMQKAIHENMYNPFGKLLQKNLGTYVGKDSNQLLSCSDFGLQPDLLYAEFKKHEIKTDQIIKDILGCFNQPSTTTTADPTLLKSQRRQTHINPSDSEFIQTVERIQNKLKELTLAGSVSSRVLKDESQRKDAEA